MKFEKVAVIIAVILGIDYYHNGKPNKPIVAPVSNTDITPPTEDYSPVTPPVVPQDKEPTKTALRVKAVIFTADWCAPCIKLKNTLDEFASKGWTNGKDPSNPLEYCYFEQEEKVHQQYKITIYPTVIYFVDGKPSTRLNGCVDAMQIVTVWNELNRKLEK